MNSEKRIALIAVAIANIQVMIALTPMSVMLPTIATDLDVGLTTAS